MARRLISVVMPVFNEAESLPVLFGRLSAAAEGMAVFDFEFVFVDDGSTDGSFELLREMARKDARVRVVTLDGHHGQAQPLQVALDAARGEIRVSLDADLEHAPEDIPRFVEKLEEGYDLVCGRREARADGLLKTIPSRIANAMLRRMTGLGIGDFGGGFRALRAGEATRFRLVGGFHRFVPALVHLRGGRVAEIPIRVVRRRFGRSHYGLERTFTVLRDLMALAMFMRGARRTFAVLFGAGVLTLAAGIRLLTAYAFPAGGLIAAGGMLVVLSCLALPLACKIKTGGKNYRIK